MTLCRYLICGHHALMNHDSKQIAPIRGAIYTLDMGLDVVTVLWKYIFIMRDSNTRSLGVYMTLCRYLICGHHALMNHDSKQIAPIRGAIYTLDMSLDVVTVLWKYIFIMRDSNTRSFGGIYDTMQIFDMWTPRTHEPRLETDCAHQRCYIYTRYGSGCSYSIVEVYIHHERQH